MSIYSLTGGSAPNLGSSGRISGGSGLQVSDAAWRDFGPALPGDARDDAQMQAFSPDPSRPWWEAMAVYGLTRAIDNRFAPPSVSGNVNAGSFAGSNGRTYGNTPNNAPPPAPAQGPGMGSMLLIGAAAVAAFLAFG